MKEFIKLTTECDHMIYISIYSIEAIEENSKVGGSIIWMNGKSCFTVKESVEDITSKLSIRGETAEEEDTEIVAPVEEVQYRKYRAKDTNDKA